ncbi:MAG: hypothetical protein M3136_02585 [Thermoproteota archaeon]|nr:hypothetical protein [Thermoproteota archaeon]MDQ4018164.1 hypothetical protein [Thermoproteota archaeon]
MYNSIVTFMIVHLWLEMLGKWKSSSSPAPAKNDDYNDNDPNFEHRLDFVTGL